MTQVQFGGVHRFEATGMWGKQAKLKARLAEIEQAEGPAIYGVAEGWGWDEQRQFGRTVSASFPTRFLKAVILTGEDKSKNLAAFFER